MVDEQVNYIKENLALVRVSDKNDDSTEIPMAIIGLKIQEGKTCLKKESLKLIRMVLFL